MGGAEALLLLEVGLGGAGEIEDAQAAALDLEAGGDGDVEGVELDGRVEAVAERGDDAVRRMGPMWRATYSAEMTSAMRSTPRRWRRRASQRLRVRLRAGWLWLSPRVVLGSGNFAAPVLNSMRRRAKKSPGKLSF